MKTIYKKFPGWMILLRPFVIFGSYVVLLADVVCISIVEGVDGMKYHVFSPGGTRDQIMEVWKE